MEASQKYGWYCRNTGYNAFTAEGKKTCALELCEQYADLTGKGTELGGARFAAPDWVVVSVGDGQPPFLLPNERLPPGAYYPG